VKKFGHTNREFNRIAKKPFKKTQRCIPVGSTTPAKSCSATPPTGP
jgi:hypothetical protein